MPDWERDREKVEFERASMLFKPLNFTMSSKFVSAGTSEEADKGDEKKEKVLTESEKAVKMKLFGNLTRYVWILFLCFLILNGMSVDSKKNADL